LEAGITLGSDVLFAAIGAAVVGLVLQQFLDRLVWLVFLAGVGAANIVLLYVWVDAYIPVNVEAGPAYLISHAAITFAISLVVRLLFTLLLLMMLFLSKKLAAAFITFGVVLSLGVVVVVALLFSMPGWASELSDMYQDSTVVTCAAPEVYVMWSSALIVSALALVLAGFLFVQMIGAYRNTDTAHGSALLRPTALLRNTIVCGLMTLTLTEQVVVTSLDCPHCPLLSQMLLIFGRFMLPTAIRLLLLLCTVLNSWVTSYMIQSKMSTSSVAVQANLLDRGEKPTIPSQYHDY
jgi:hypothetical protein